MNPTLVACGMFPCRPQKVLVDGFNRGLITHWSMSKDKAKIKSEAETSFILPFSSGLRMYTKATEAMGSVALVLAFVPCQKFLIDFKVF